MWLYVGESLTSRNGAIKLEMGAAGKLELTCTHSNRKLWELVSTGSSSIKGLKLKVGSWDTANKLDRYVNQ